MVARILALTLLIAAACGPYSAQAGAPGSGSNVQQLVIMIGSSRHVADTGVGYVYRAPVVKVLDGTLADDAISLHVFPNPNGRLYAGHFRAFDDPPATLRFTRLPEGTNVYEGFTAHDGTSWKLVSVDPK